MTPLLAMALRASCSHLSASFASCNSGSPNSSERGWRCSIMVYAPSVRTGNLPEGHNRDSDGHHKMSDMVRSVNRLTAVTGGLDIGLLLLPTKRFQLSR